MNRKFCNNVQLHEFRRLLRTAAFPINLPRANNSLVNAQSGGDALSHFKVWTFALFELMSHLRFCTSLHARWHDERQ